jgi:uncharacterized protein DUF4154
MRGRWRLPVALIPAAAIALLLLLPRLVSAQEVTGPALKAAYIFQFAKFTDWPTNVPGAAEPFVMCVSGDTPVADALERAVAGRIINAHKVIVVREPPVADQRVCQVLYSAALSADRARQLIAGLRDAPVLTISDLDGFAQQGGVAQFFYEEGRLKFTVRIDAAKRARLQISSRLLGLSISK